MITKKTLILMLALSLILIFMVITQLKKNDSPKTVVKSDQFTIINTNLSDNPIGPFSPIEVHFSEPVEKDGMLIVIEPEIAFTIRAEETNLTIAALDGWEFGKEHKLIIKKGTLSKSKSHLGKDYIYNFRIVPYDKHAD